uniref:Origin recognition complex subunit 4 n=1 Tax=Clastoptera arizonana TaxID=38151 RepID=A0A1B6E7S1_9HEMI
MAKIVKVSPNEEQLSNDYSLFLCKKIIKKQLYSYTNITGFSKEFEEVYNVVKRTIEFGESDSVLVIGPRGSGKTALVHNVFKQLKETNKMMKDTIIVPLNGFIHTDDSLALKEIICQLHLEFLAGDKVTGSFADNLLFLLQSLKTGDKEVSKPVIFVLDEFHLFCTHRNQTLLYNLFDAAQSSQAPICVIGLTSRGDVTELLEKRVKSRFSHRQILLLKEDPFENFIERFQDLLSIDVNDNNLTLDNVDPVFIHCWNEEIGRLATNTKVVQVLKKLHFSSSDQRVLRNFLFLLVSRIDNVELRILPEHVVECYQSWSKDAKVNLLEGLSVLELCLVIAMSHQSEIYDDDPFNFEMIINRYLKFANQNSAVQIVHKPVIMKAFERIKDLEIIVPINRQTGGGRVQKEYQLYNFLLTKEQIREAVQNFVGLPTDVSQWARISVV